ncbi:MAG: ferrous iron transport protein A [Clostridia bacterium]|nr:ferrous iron transport protein A [Clostridia bacterium]
MLTKGVKMEKTLDKFSIGDRGVVVNVIAERKIKRRLFDMGITPGVEIYLRKRAPLGDPIEITLRGYELTLRLSEASCVLMGVKNA